MAAGALATSGSGQLHKAALRGGCGEAEFGQGGGFIRPLGTNPAGSVALPTLAAQGLIRGTGHSV